MDFGSFILAKVSLFNRIGSLGLLLVLIFSFFLLEAHIVV